MPTQMGTHNHPDEYSQPGLEHLALFPRVKPTLREGATPPPCVLARISLDCLRQSACSQLS